MNETQEEARRAVRNIATAWNRAEEEHKMKFREKANKAIERSYKYVTTNKSIAKKGQSIGKQFQKPVGKAKKHISFGTAGYQKPKIL